MFRVKLSSNSILLHPFWAPVFLSIDSLLMSEMDPIPTNTLFQGCVLQELLIHATLNIIYVYATLTLLLHSHEGEKQGEGGCVLT